MKRLILLTALFVSSYGAPQGYNLGTPSTGLTTGPGVAAGGRPGTQAGLIVGGGLTTGPGISSVSGVTTGQGNTFQVGVSAGTGSGATFQVGTHGTGAGTTFQVGTSGSPAGVGVSAGTQLTTVPGTSAGSATVEGVSVFPTDTTGVVCNEGEVLHIDGTCVVPEISRKVFVFDVPQQEITAGPLPSVPPPRVDHNVLFVRLPEGGTGPEPIVVPPPRQNNIVYVLNKQSEQSQRVIEVPAPPASEPEIYFVNYDDGENPTLPGGLDLASALGSASETSGQVLGVAGGFGGAGQGVEAGIGGAGVGEGGLQGVGTGFGVSGAGGNQVVVGGGIGQIGAGIGGTGIGSTGVSGGNIGVSVVQQGGQGSNTPTGLYSTP